MINSNCPLMKSLYPALLICLLTGIVACNDDSGIQEIELTLDTEYFDRIRLETSSDVRIIQSDIFRVVLTGEERDVNDVEVNVINDRLTIDENGSNHQDLLIKIYVPEISELQSLGSSFIFGESHFTQNRDLNISLTGSGEIDFAIDTDDLDVELSGSGDIFLEGNVQTLDTDLSGSGWVKSFGLESELTDVRINGSGSAEVTVITDLDVFIHSSGNVFYKGHPTINAQITGSGELIDAN